MTSDVREAEEAVEQLARLAYEKYNRSFVPCYPWTFIRVLPKNQIMQNGVYLPADQNKTVHEGIVLCTWKPFTNAKGVEKVCTVKPGDHVLFNHFSGVNIEGYSRMLYRVVRSEDWKENEQGGIFATVEYESKDSGFGILTELIRKNRYELEMSDSTELAKIIADRFLLVDKEATSVTLSGK